MLFKSPFIKKNFLNKLKLKGVDFYTFHAGFKKRKKDLLIVVFKDLATTSGVMTKSSLPAAPVEWDKKILNEGKCKVLIVNSGIANAFTGEKGQNAIKENIKFASKIFGCNKKHVYLSSTGLIGEHLDYKKINEMIYNINQKKKNTLYEASKAIMTTDSFAKICSKKFNYNNKTFNVAGIAKGSGMISPNMATMLAYIFVDIPVSKKILDEILFKSVEYSFNSITVDGCTSTNDTVLLFSLKNNKLKEIINNSDPRLRLLEKNVKLLMKELAQQIVMDGEGISKFIAITVNSAKNLNQAKNIAFSIANSNLVKTAVAGRDPNWGRIVAAIGQTEEKIINNKLKIYFGKHCVCKNGAIVKKYNEAKIKKYMKNKKIEINIILNTGKYSKTIWTSDLTKKYVEINSEYTT